MYEFYYISFFPKAGWYDPAQTEQSVLVIKSGHLSFDWRNNPDLVSAVEELEEQGATIVDIYRYEFLSRKKVSLYN